MKIAVVNLITRTPSHHKVPVIDSNKDAMIVKLCLELQRCGCDVDLYVSDLYQPQQNEDLGLNVIYLKTYLKFLPEIPFVPSLAGHLRNRYDVILTSEVFQWAVFFEALAKLTSFKKRSKLLVWQELALHQKIFKSIPSILFHKIILRFVLESTIDLYIPRSDRARDFLRNQGVNSKKIAPNLCHGIDQHVFFPETSNANRTYIFSPSRLVHDKGIDLLLNAFKRLRKNHMDIDLIIQGDGPLAAEYEKLAEDLGVSANVQILRTRVSHDEMRQYYANAAIMVLASRKDNIPLAVMESLACGTPVLLSDVIDIAAEVVRLGGGFSFVAQDAEMLYQKLEDFFNPRLALAETLTIENAANVYKNNFIAKRLLDTISTTR